MPASRTWKKKFLSENGFSCANFSLAHDLQSFTDGVRQIGTPLIVKTAEFGYDGKGQIRLSDQLSQNEIEQAWKTFEGGRVVIEERINLETELSVLVARDYEGNTVYYDPVENIHRNHILDISIAPARISPEIQNKAYETTLEIAHALKYVGMLAVEFLYHRTADCWLMS